MLKFANISYLDQFFVLNSKINVCNFLNQALWLKFKMADKMVIIAAHISATNCSRTPTFCCIVTFSGLKKSI